jgi:hypothetical protein
MDFEFGGGPVRFGKSIYVPRDADKKLRSLTDSKRTLVAITAPRQSGKTSLLLSAQSALRAAGQRVAFLDFREIFGTPNEENRTADRWFPILFRALARAMHINPQDVQQWLSEVQGDSATHRTVAFVEKFLRDRIKSPLTLMFDEIDVVRLYWHHTDDFFDALRVLATRRDETDISIVLAGITHPTALLKILAPSTFNLAVPLNIPDFQADRETVAAWAEGLTQEGDMALALAAAALEQTGGQPFLTAALMNDLAESGIDRPEDVPHLAAQLVDDVRSGDRPMAHFLTPGEVILENEKDATAALTLYERLLEQPIAKDDVESTAAQLLRIAGLTIERQGLVMIKSSIYCRYFNQKWVTATKAEVGRRGGERSRRGRSHLKGRELKDQCHQISRFAAPGCIL